jgi:hypothetical protein
VDQGVAVFAALVVTAAAGALRRQAAPGARQDKYPSTAGS